MKSNIFIENEIRSFILNKNIITDIKDNKTENFEIQFNQSAFTVLTGETLTTGIFHYDSLKSELHLNIQGYYFKTSLVSEESLQKVSASKGDIFSKLPGKIIAVHAKNGDIVKKGTILLVQEAMKMEHAMMAEQDGIIDEIHVALNQVIDADILLVSFKKG